MGITYCADLQQLSLEQLNRYFGKFGDQLLLYAQGLDQRPVCNARIRQSLSVETTYAHDLSSLEACIQQLPALMQAFQQRWQPHQQRYQIRKQFVKMKFQHFKQTTVETTHCDLSLAGFQPLIEQAWQRQQVPVRLLGIGVRLKPIETDSKQIALF